MEAQKRREAEFMELVSKLTTELDLSRLLNHVVDPACDMLSCERATVFLNDEKQMSYFLWWEQALALLKYGSPITLVYLALYSSQGKRKYPPCLR